MVVHPTVDGVPVLPSSTPSFHDLYPSSRWLVVGRPQHWMIAPHVMEPQRVAGLLDKWVEKYGILYFAGPIEFLALPQSRVVVFSTSQEAREGSSHGRLTIEAVHEGASVSPLPDRTFGPAAAPTAPLPKHGGIKSRRLTASTTATLSNVVLSRRTSCVTLLRRS